MQNLLNALREALLASDVEATKSTVALIVAADKDRPADEYINGNCHPVHTYDDKYFQSFETACVRFVVDELAERVANLDDEGIYDLAKTDGNGTFGYTRYTDWQGHAWWFFGWGGSDNSAWCSAECIGSDEPYFEDEWDESAK